MKMGFPKVSLFLFSMVLLASARELLVHNKESVEESKYHGHGYHGHHHGHYPPKTDFYHYHHHHGHYPPTTERKTLETTSDLKPDHYHHGYGGGYHHGGYGYGHHHGGHGYYPPLQKEGEKRN